jgi:hypothetical protein
LRWSKLYAYGVRQQANEWGVGRGADRTWSVKKKRKESKRDIPVSVRRRLILDGATMRGGSGHPICVGSTWCWRREAAARGCWNGDPQGSQHVGRVGELGRTHRKGGGVVSFSTNEKRTNRLT